jgi:hypothetical protein
MTSASCAFPPCPQPAVLTLGLKVDGCDLALPTCQRHADWLARYTQDDAAMSLVDRMLTGSMPGLPEDSGESAS